MAEQEKLSSKIQRRINNLTKLRDKLVERNWWLTEPQYSWFAKNNSDLVKWIRKIVQNSWVWEIKERWWDTSLSRPDMPFSTMWKWIPEWVGAWMFNPFVGWIDQMAWITWMSYPEWWVWRLAPEALWVLRAWARNGKNYMYDLQKKYWWQGKEYNQYIKALEDIDNNLNRLWEFNEKVWQWEKYEADKWNTWYNALDDIINTDVLNYINNQIKDTAIDNRYEEPKDDPFKALDRNNVYKTQQQIDAELRQQWWDAYNSWNLRWNNKDSFKFPI